MNCNTIPVKTSLFVDSAHLLLILKLWITRDFVIITRVV